MLKIILVTLLVFTVPAWSFAQQRPRFLRRFRMQQRHGAAFEARGPEHQARDGMNFRIVVDDQQQPRRRAGRGIRIGGKGQRIAHACLR